MSSPFQERVQEALADKGLRIALDRATAQLGDRRKNALQSLDNSDVIRDISRYAKMDLLRDLSGNLQRFEQALQSNGAHVHWAEDGPRANGIIVDIAKQGCVKLVVKSKSMVSEETHLNEALEHAGVEVVDTDLGEYIVQLARSRPSHIIAPIIHMSRADVGRVMEQRIGVPFSDDPKTLARYAREKLRNDFLRADMGITGANFGVVETGTICLVTNEGNGGMVTTLPRIHVVLMGIEKLVPTLAHLDLFLKILARSATGQKLSVYTTLVSGPKGRDHESGPEQVHVILLDNGRSNILAGATAEILGCIRCGACLNACPVYKNIGGHAYGDTYAGPIGSIVTPGLKGLHDWKELPGASSLCGACREVCPVRLDIPKMLLSLRKTTVEQGWGTFELRVAMTAFGIVARNPILYRFFAALVRWVLRRSAPQGWVKTAPGLAAGWTKVRDLKVPAARNFQQQWRARKRGK
jgi:L-lactate dehydrogenase complex protein LldF